MVTVHPEETQLRVDEYKPTLLRLIEKYPHKPALWNYITELYGMNYEKDKREEAIYETVRRFPNYLFGLAELAMLYLQKGDPDQAFETIRRSQNLLQLYPERRAFHFNEVRALYQLLVFYHCMKDHMEEAEAHFEFLQEICPEDDRILKIATEVMHRCRVKYHLMNALNRMQDNN